MTIVSVPEQRVSSPPPLVPHPGVDPADTAAAVLEVMQLGAVGFVETAPAVLGPCELCPTASPVPENPAEVVLAWRQSEDEFSWLWRTPLCSVHLFREAARVVAIHKPVWIESGLVIV